MAKRMAGDYRDRERVRAWVRKVAAVLGVTV
jgi:hypothetical protein